jgi:hypothetical protein
VSAGHLTAGTLAGHAATLIPYSRVLYRIGHSTPVQAVVAALAAALVGSVLNLVLNRQRMSWRVYSDEPLDPIPAQAKSIKKDLEFEVYLRHKAAPPDGPTGGDVPGSAAPRPSGLPVLVPKPSIVVIRVRNSAWSR